MKTDYGWYDGGNGTNTSGFSGLPGDKRNFVGMYDDGWGGQFGYWWSSTHEWDEYAWARGLNCWDEEVWRDYEHNRSSFSVRCVREAE